MATALGQLLLNAEQRWPKRPALHIGGVDYQYDTLLARSRLMAAALIDLTDNIAGPIRALLAIDKSVDGYSAIIATQLAEQTWIPLSPSFPTERNCRIIEQAKPNVLVLSPAYRAQAEQLVAHCDSDCKLVFIGWQDSDHNPNQSSDQSSDQYNWIAKLNQANIMWLSEASLAQKSLSSASKTLPAVDRPCDLAYIMFTSGSTGLPKGVSVTQSNVMAYLQRMDDIYQADCEDKFSQFFEFTFDLSVHDLFVCWQAGACLYPAGLADNLMPTAYVRRHGLTFWFSVPTMAASLNSLGQLKPDSMPSLKHVLFCGEALPNKVVTGFRAAAVNALVDNLYGPTEATIAFTMKRFERFNNEQANEQGNEKGNEKAEEQTDEHFHGIAGIGRAFDGLATCVVDEHNRVCATGEKGELLLGGDQLAAGYWQRDDLTAQVFIEVDVDADVSQTVNETKRWYRSGDLASIDEHGEIAFFGRIDNQIKIRGYRIELQEVEQLIAKATGVSHVAAVAVYEQGAASAKSIDAFVVTDKSADELQALCKAHLPAYMVPEHIEVMDKLPTNASGKVDRKQLKARD